MLVLISYLGISRMGEIEDNLRYNTDILLTSIEKLIQADRDLNQALVSERTLIQTEPGSAAFNALVKDIHENIRQCKERVGYYQTHATLPEQRKLLEAFASDFQKWQDIDQEVIKLAQDKSPASRQGAAALSLTRGKQQFETARGYLDKLEEISLDFAAQRKVEARHHYLQATRTILVILILVVIFCLFIGTTTWRAVTVPLAAIISFTQRVADGDLSQTLPVLARNEMGRLTEALNNSVQSLRTIIEKAVASARQMASSTQQLSASAEQNRQVINQITQAAQELAGAAERQSRYVQDSIEKMEGNSAAIEQVAATTQEVAAAAGNARLKAEEGNRAMDQACREMDEINESTLNVSRIINELGERSKTIEQIVDLISGIADQTNLLALNAAIEAARAGEHGRGFAVVAEEVRKLADQSSQAAKEIAALIGQIQKDTFHAVQAMENSKQLVGRGIQVIAQGGETFRQIQDAVNSVCEQIKEVSLATDEMAGNITEMVESLKKIGELAQQIAAATQNIAGGTEEELASMEEIASAAGVLAGMGHDLQQIACKFKL